MSDDALLCFAEVCAIILDGGCSSMVALCHLRGGSPDNYGEYVLYSLDKPHRHSVVGVAMPSFGGKCRIGLGITLWSGQLDHLDQVPQQFNDSRLSREISLGGQLFDRATYQSSGMGSPAVVMLHNQRSRQPLALSRSPSSSHSPFFHAVHGVYSESRGCMSIFSRKHVTPSWLDEKWQELLPEEHRICELEALWLSCAAGEQAPNVLCDWFEKHSIPGGYADFFTWRLPL